MTLTLLIYFVAFLLIYFISDARHDVWIKEESDERLKAKRAGRIGDKELQQLHLKKASKASSKWHALDAAIKGFVIANLSWWIMGGWDWWILFLAFDAAIIRWITFDLAWNKFRGVKWNYVGATAQTDKIFKSALFQFYFKAFLLLCAIILTTHKIQIGL